MLSPLQRMAAVSQVTSLKRAARGLRFCERGKTNRFYYNTDISERRASSHAHEYAILKLFMKLWLSIDVCIDHMT